MARGPDQPLVYASWQDPNAPDALPFAVQPSNPWGAPESPGYPDARPFVASGGPGSQWLPTPAPGMGAMRFPFPDERVPQPEMGTIPPLGSGVLLKNGRYRVTGPFYPSQQEAPLEEPPLLVAHDSGALDAKVLIQELPIAGGLQSDMRTARELVAQRLLALSPIPGFARLIDNFADYDRQFLVFEYPQGETLAFQLARTNQPMPERVVITIALQLLDVLIPFEKEFPPFIHGNLNPQVIFLRPDGQIALAGISATLLVYQAGSVPGGAAGGVPGYAAPEQLRSQASNRSDQYGVCAVMYRMLTGVEPRQGMSTVFKPAHALREDISVDLDEIVNRGLRPPQAQRFDSLTALRDALRPLLGSRSTRRTFTDNDEVMTTLRRNDQGRIMMPPVRLWQSPISLLLVALLIIGIAGAPVMLTLWPQPHLPSVEDADQRAAAAALFQQHGIGLSNGTLIFDSHGPANSEKQAGAQALASGDYRLALQHFGNAQQIDHSDAEAVIYGANVEAVLSGRPVVTVVAAVAFDADATPSGIPGSASPDDARAELQGVALAQQQINFYHLLPDGALLEVAILNSGPDPSNVEPAAQLLVDEVSMGNPLRVIGVVGWPESAQSLEGISALAPSGLAILSPSASEDSLAGGKGNFFSMVPNNSKQAAIMAQATLRHTTLRKVTVLGVSSTYGRSMSAAYAKAVQQANLPQIVVHTQLFDEGDAGALDAAARSVTNPATDALVLFGSDLDAVLLGHSVATDLHGALPLVLVGPAADTSALTGFAYSTASDFARQDPASVAALSVATLANSGAWGSLASPVTPSLDLAQQYHGLFGQTGGPNGSWFVPALTVLSRDATRVLAEAAKREMHQAGHAGPIDPTRIRTGLRLIDTEHPFVGVGGAVAFSITGVQVQRTLTIMQYNANATTNSSLTAASPVVAFVVGDRAQYCGASSTCALS